MRFSDCGEDMAKTMLFGCQLVGKAKFILRFKKNRGKSGGYGCSFYKEQGRARTKQIYKFDE